MFRLITTETYCPIRAALHDHHQAHHADVTWPHCPYEPCTLLSPEYREGK